MNNDQQRAAGRPGERRGALRLSLPVATCVWLGTALCGGSWLPGHGRVTAAGAAQTGAVQPQPGPGSVGPALATYCVSCHNDKRATAGLSLEAFDAGAISANPHVWEPVIRRLRTRTMPPAGMPRPDERLYDAMASFLETAIDTVAAKRPNPGRTAAFHRLNRIEYHNAVNDLLAIDVDVNALLPADNTFEGGFDNNGAALSVSPTQIERYLSAASKISRLAVGIAPASAGAEIHRVHLNLIQDDRADEDQPFGSRGGISIRHYFPVDGEYGVRIQLQKQYNDYIRGMGQRQQLDVRVDGARVARFSVGGEAKGKTAPASFAGNILGDPEWEKYVLNADANLEVRFPAEAGPRVVTVSFERAQAEAEGVLQPRQTGFPLAADERYHGNAAVDSVAISGPYSTSGPGDTPSRRRIFVCRPAGAGTEEPCARRILSDLARRAYRRPVAAADTQALLAFYREGRLAPGGSFDAGIQRAIERLLVDPEFLFRIERDPAGVAPGGAYPVSDVVLASRLSFFLWNSIPDDQLLDLAARGQLRQPGVLEREVQRMLADDRASSIVTNFAAQWLNLRNLDDVLPDPDRFPEFDENLRRGLRRETELFIESTLREDRSIVDLVAANYTFVNERVAEHYGIDGVYGQQFRRVTFKTGEPRGGLLGQGSILTISSHPTRTSPVLRGKWLLQNLLGTTPPEPPANVPTLPEPADGTPTTVRQLLERHRASPACASCHAPIDPLGLALENFDPIGRWRSDDGGAPIDAAAVTPAGVHFEGPAGLRELLLAQRSLFVGAVTEKLLAYAIGRGLDDYDGPTVRQILRDSAPSDHRWSSLVLAIVKSPAFQMRRSWSPPVTAAADGARGSGAIAASRRP